MTQPHQNLSSIPTDASSDGDHTDCEENQHADADRTASAVADTDADGSAPDTDRDELPLDQVFAILKNSRRRQTITYLRENGGAATLSDIAEHVAALENGVAKQALTSSQRKRVYVGLYQCHLPKLDDTQIVEFDKHRGTVELTATADQLDPYLGGSHTRWPLLYGGLTAAGFGLFVLSRLAGAPAGLTPTTVLFVVLVGGALCSTAHAYAESDSTEI